MNSYKVTEIKKGSKNYPKELLDLKDAPEKMFVKGELPSNFTNCLAVVGSRRITRYGSDITSTFVESLVLRGATIISGFMYGVDTAAHKAAILAGGKTIAVLANGLNYIYPPENNKLYTEILHSGGAIISEYPMDFKPQLWTYPKRNRIVAALSLLGTLVIEAAEQSGSLITASYADALNRPLYAIPGSVFSNTSKGTNLIVKTGVAKMVTTPDDILPAVVSNSNNTSLFEDLNMLEKEILDKLKEEELTIDELSKMLKHSVSEIIATLTKLSLKNIILETQGKYFLKRKKL